MELDNTAELVFFKSVQVTKLPKSISQAENAGSIPVTRSIESAAQSRYAPPTSTQSVGCRWRANCAKCAHSCHAGVLPVFRGTGVWVSRLLIGGLGSLSGTAHVGPRSFARRGPRSSRPLSPDRLAASRAPLGKPTIRGHRLWVSLILGHLAEGWTVDAVLVEFPQLEVDDVRACIAYGARLADVRFADLDAAG